MLLAWLCGRLSSDWGPDSADYIALFIACKDIPEFCLYIGEGVVGRAKDPHLPLPYLLAEKPQPTRNPPKQRRQNTAVNQARWLLLCIGAFGNNY